MAKTLQFRRGTTAELDAITGAEGELFVDLDTDTVRVHDGVTLGGVTLVNQTSLNTKVNSVGNNYVNNAITRYDGTTGTVIQNSLVTISDTGAITAPNNTGSMIPFYYPTLDSFPVATESHGAVAHAHDTGKLYYAHGSWIELANMSDVDGGATAFTGLSDRGDLTVDRFYLSAITMLSTTNNSASSYRFDQYGTVDNPTVYAISGTTIAFNLNVAGHPFLIQTSAGANYNIGLVHVTTGGTVTTGASAQGKTSGTLYWKIPSTTTGNYRYICSIHSGMMGTISIKDIVTI